MVNISIEEIMNGRVSSFLFKKINNSSVINSFLEFNNIGSIPFRTRVRIDIFGNNGLINTIWSNEKIIRPSEKKNFKIFSYINKTGDYYSEVRVYYGGNILDYKNFSFKMTDAETPKNIFEIKRLRASDKQIKFSIKSLEDCKNIVILFSGYPESWIVEENIIGSLTKNNLTPITINYIPIEWENKKMIVHIFSEDGKYFMTKEIMLEREYLFKKVINNILDFFEEIS